MFSLAPFPFISLQTGLWVAPINSCLEATNQSFLLVEFYNLLCWDREVWGLSSFPELHLDGRGLLWVILLSRHCGRPKSRGSRGKGREVCLACGNSGNPLSFSPRQPKQPNRIGQWTYLSIPVLWISNLPNSRHTAKSQDAGLTRHSLEASHYTTWTRDSKKKCFQLSNHAKQAAFISFRETGEAHPCSHTPGGFWKLSNNHKRE